jgi:hypothetical protein
MSNRRRGQKAKKRWDKGFEKFIDGLNRKILVYLSDTQNECPNCYYDKVNGKSSGIAKSSPGDSNYFVSGRCPVCNGKGVVITTRRKSIKGVVIWDPAGEGANALTFTSGGRESATKVQIKVDANYLELLRDCKHVVIDGITCKLAAPPLLRGIGKQSIVVVEFFTSSKTKDNSGEIYKN